VPRVYDDDDDYEEEPFEEDAGPDLGPDERDRDLMDGSWEARYYAGRERTRDWNTIGIGVALILLIAFLLPMFLVFVD
jgi:hypothetical protein